MREVVQCLLTKHSEALVELQELRLAVDEILKTLADLDRIAQSLATDVERVRRSSVGPVPIVLAVHDRVTALSSLTSQVLAAFRELERGIKGWEVGNAGSPTSNGTAVN
ncbi:MAG TPA: hypothetical protein VFQ35_19600 [Polyangiaceae bacterium]|nr:hypothetical protein [Polyangiaceae bacterium]